MASYNGHAVTVDYLVKAGADIHAKDKVRHTHNTHARPPTPPHAPPAPPPRLGVPFWASGKGPLVVTEVEKGRVWFTTFMKPESKTESSYGILRVEFGVGLGG